MSKVFIKSEVVKGHKKIKATDVTQVVVSNYDTDAETTFSLNGITRYLPARSLDFGVPVAPFKMENCGHTFDIDLDFPATTVNVVLDIMQLPTTKEKC